MNKCLLTVVTVMLVGALLCPSASAETLDLIADGSWHDLANWYNWTEGGASSHLPTSADSVHVRANATITGTAPVPRRGSR